MGEEYGGEEEDGGDDMDGEEGSGVRDIEEHVEEVMRHLPDNGDVIVEYRKCDEAEERQIHEFLQKSCHCSKWDCRACSGQFTYEYIREVRNSCYELSKCELDLVLKGQLMATMNTSSYISHNTSQVRMRGYSSNHYHGGKVVCEEMFMFLYGVCRTRMKNLKKSLEERGIGPRIHGNTKRRPHHALSHESVEYVVHFLLSYSEEHALLLPGRVPGYSRTDIKLLPSSTSKKRIWRVYQEAAQQDPSVHPVAYTTFCRLWRQLLPSLLLMKPMTDLCWTCQKNSTAILRAANCPDKEKSCVLRKAEDHLRVVQCERSHYKTTCDTCKKDIQVGICKLSFLLFFIFIIIIITLPHYNT